MNKVKLPNYTSKEEFINSVSHGIGACLSIIALILLIEKATTKIETLVILVYGISLFLLYLVSCLYHALSSNLLGKKILRVIDHCNVLLLEAGIYTPICICLIGGLLGWIIFIIVWIFTFIAIILNIIDVDRYQTFSLICHLIEG